MTCREVTELLIDYATGDLPPTLLEYLREHLGECPPCVNYLKTYQLTIRLTRQLPDVPLPADLIEKLRNALEENK